MPRYSSRRGHPSYQWLVTSMANDDIKGSGGVNLSSEIILPPLEGKIVRWVGHLTLTNKEPSGGNGYTAALMAAIAPGEMSDAGWTAMWNDGGLQPTDWYTQANARIDDFPLYVPMGITAATTISLPFDQRAKRRWHRGENLRFGIYHAEPGSSDSGLAISAMIRVLMQFD